MGRKEGDKKCDKGEGRGCEMKEATQYVISVITNLHWQWPPENYQSMLAPSIGIHSTECPISLSVARDTH